MLKIDHLTKCYGNQKAVDDLTLHIQAGEIYGFIGHNGAGKTTTLKATVGILPFDNGEITIHGISVQKDPIACKRELAYIPDNAYRRLFPRNEAKAGYHQRLDSRAKADCHG